MLFAVKLGSIIQAILMLAILLGIGFYFWRRKRKAEVDTSKDFHPRSGAPSKIANEVPVEPSPPTFPLDDADEFQSTTPEADFESNPDPSDPLDVGSLSESSLELEDELARESNDEVIDEDIEVGNTPFPVDSGIDDVLANASSFATQPLEPDEESSISIPPAPNVPPIQKNVPPIQENVAPPPASTGSGIPPRRYEVGRGSQAVTTPVPAATPIKPLDEDDSDDIEVLGQSDTIGLGVFTDSDAAELADLRLALEASHNELSHLTSQRDQALSRATQHEEELARLRHQLHELSASQEALQAERAKVEALKAELSQVHDQLEQSDAVSAAVAETESKYQASLDELRVLLAQREAVEASLARERDNLAAQNEELQRRLNAGDVQVDDDSTTNQLANLEMQHQQVGAELSLANETVRQLNQNITQRDSELMSLRHQVHLLNTQLEEVAQAEPDEAAQRELEERQQAALDELGAVIEQKDAELHSLRDDVQTLNRQVQEAEVAQQIEQQHQATVAELRGTIEEREVELESLREQVQSLNARWEEAELAQSGPDESALQEMEEQHVATVSELRALIEQRDASLAELSGQNQELAARVTELSESQTPDRSAELSLANETVRQLNQALTQRDAELINLRRELQALQLESQEVESSGELTAESERIKQELEQAQAACAELEAAQNRQRNEFASVRETLHEEISAAKSEHQNTVEELEAARNQVDEQALVIEKLRDERNAGQHRLAALQAQFDNADLGAIEKLTVERDDALERYDKLQIDFAHAVKASESEELTKLQAKLKEKTADFDALQAKHHTLKARFSAETEALRGKLEGLQQQLALNTESLGETEPASSLTEHANADSAPALDRIAELEATVEQQERATESLQAEHRDLLDRLGAAQEEINAKASEMRRMREVLQVAETAAQEGAQQKQAYSELQEAERELAETAQTQAIELKRLQDTQIELKQQLAHYVDAEETWRNERVALLALAGLDENREPLEQTEVESLPVTADDSLTIQQLEATLAERDEVIRSLNERFHELKTMYDSSDDASVLHDDVSDPMDALRSERDQAASAAADASAKIAELMSELHQIRSDQSGEADRLAKLEEENREYRRSVAELHASLNELEEFKLERTREQESARQRLQEATRANAELTAELAEERAKKQQPPSEREVPSTGDANLADEVTALRAQLNKLQRDRKHQETLVGKLQAELEATPEDLKVGAKAIRDVKRLTARLEAQERKLTGRDDRLQELAAEIGKLRSEASSLKNELAEQQAIARARGRSSRVEGHANASSAVKNGEVARKAKTASKKVARKKTAASKTARKKPTKVKKKSAAKKSTIAKSAKQKAAEQKDDLKRIQGIGPVLEKRLNAIGVYQFKQVKAWTKSTVAKLDEELGLRGRIQRENWIAQAKKLAR